MEKEIKEFTEAVGAAEPIPGGEEYTLFRKEFKKSHYFIFGKKFMVVKMSRTVRPFWGPIHTQIDVLIFLL